MNIVAFRTLRAFYKKHSDCDAMNIAPIKNEKAYQKALEELENVFDAEPNTTEGDKGEVLMLLIMDYEKKHYPIDSPDPIEAIKSVIAFLKNSKTDSSTHDFVSYLMDNLATLVRSQGGVNESKPNKEGVYTQEQIKDCMQQLENIAVKLNIIAGARFC